MALILVAFILLFSGKWDKTFLVDAQSCVDERAFKEEVVHEGQQFPSYQLRCPLELQGSPPPKLTWQKDCQPLLSEEGKLYLEFTSLSGQHQGNYTCMQQGNSTASFTVLLTVKVPDSQCSRDPEFMPRGYPQHIYTDTEEIVALNCTVLLYWDPKEEHCDTTLHWSRYGQPFNQTHCTQNTSSWSPAAGQLMVTSLLMIPLTQESDYGLYLCTVRNLSTTFDLPHLNIISCYGGPNHAAAVIAAIVLLLLLAVAAIVYSRCHLNIKLWYRNSYGDYELNDGKLYDAYISYVNNDHDRKFVNFILKPHLENKNGYKVHLNDNDILPGSEPSAELLMSMSRSRRLIVLLSHAFMEQDWCCNNFRQGLLHLLELSRQPIFILLEGQSKRMRPEIKQLLSENQHCLTILTWKHNSVTPSSVFWKELALAMPRRVLFRSESSGDPQTVLQDDKDPMLTLESEYLDCRSDTDPAGDLGLRLPVYKALSFKAPVLPADPLTAAESKHSDVDVSDLGSRNYGARSDFYCLVTKEDF